MITKSQFISAINALKKQSKGDRMFAENMGRAFPSAFDGNLMPNNDTVMEAFIQLLKDLMDDNETDWIGYYCWELDFGKENYRLKVFDGDKEVPLRTAGQLWGILNGNMKDKLKK